MGAGLRPAGQDYHPEPRGKAPVGTQQKQLLLSRRTGEAGMDAFTERGGQQNCQDWWPAVGQAWSPALLRKRGLHEVVAPGVEKESKGGLLMRFGVLVGIGQGGHGQVCGWWARGGAELRSA